MIIIYSQKLKIIKGKLKKLNNNNPKSKNEMRTVKLFSVVVLLVMLVCAKGFAQDGDDKVVGKATAKSESMKKQFKLSDEQTKSLYDLFVSTMQKENTLYKSGKSRLDMEVSKDQYHADFVAGVKKIFTEKQYAKFDRPETLKGMKTGAKWRVAKMKKTLGLSKKQTKKIYSLIVSSSKKQMALVKPDSGDKTAYYNEKIKIDDDFYSSVKDILTTDQLAKYNQNDY